MSGLARCGIIASVLFFCPYISHAGDDAGSEEKMPGEMRLEELVYKGMEDPSRFTKTPLRLMKKRNLKKYYAGREYPGSPPAIPHKVATDMEDTSNSCLACHKDGGYMPPMEAYVPLTPHPDYPSCRQCHVQQLSRKLFREIDWITVAPPKTGRPALPGGPPYIPHRMQFRENCLSCHSGPSAVFEIRSPHPERISCTQCHVPQKTERLFARAPE